MEHETKPPLIHLIRPIPTPNSTIPELISYLRSSHQKDSFDMVTKFILAREENLNNSVKELVNRNKDLELIESKHSQLVLEKASIKDELKKCRKEMDGLKDELKKCRFNCRELNEKLIRSAEELNLVKGMHDIREKRANEKYEKLLEESEETETRLREEKLRSEAETLAWKKKYHDLGQKVLKLEEDVAELVKNEEEELLGANSSGKNHDNGRTINKKFVLDLKRQSQMMTSPIIKNGRSEIIELDDSDDDKPNGNRIASTTTTPHSMPNAKRASRTEIFETNIEGNKKKRLQEMGHEQKVSSSSDDTSDLDDKALMDDLIEKVRREKECEAWKYEADMVQAFDKDHEICMNAVCAIYRQQKLKEKSSNHLLPSSNQGFNQFDVLSGTKLAELLIEGDSEGKLRKSVSDLQLHNQKALNECRKLAIRYSKQLFQIYKSKKDPFF